jgi:PAS domain S-box-containing protein
MARLIEGAPVGFVVLRLVEESNDDSLEVVLGNSVAGRYVGKELGTEIGKRFTEVFPAVPPERRRLYADVARGGPAYEGMVRAKVGDVDETFTIKAIGLGDACVGVYFENVDAQRRAEAEALNLTRFLDSIIENLPSMIFLKDALHLRFERFNKAGEDLLGLTRDQLLGKSDYDFFPKEQADFFVEADRETLRSKAVKDIPEEPIQTAHGQRWLHTKKVPIVDPDGRATYLLGISEDITDRRRAEAELRAANEAAEAANRELEAFSYSVAHDLRAPLRSIDGFSQAILEDHLETLAPEAADYLQRIVRAAKRMSEIIDDLLQLSRVTRAELRRAEVDVSTMVESVARELCAAHVERAIDTVVQPGMVAAADARLLRIAFENLIGNAFKFTGKQPRARIELGTTTQDGDVAYFVRDDGVGFDMSHAKRLFGAFERLHAKDYEGNGVGLAIVQRIVARHGGRVWAESTPGQGATFYFTLGHA